MILGKSTEPVHLKKIHLVSWSLKDEIAATFNYYHQHKPDEVDKVREFYESNLSTFKAQISTDADQENVVDIQTKAPVAAAEQTLKHRSSIERKIPNNKSYGYTFLFDVTMNSILFFAEKPFQYGSTIVVHFDKDHNFAVKAEVNYVSHIGIKSRIIGERKGKYRIRARFTLDTPGDRSLLRKFLQSVDPHYTGAPQADLDETPNIPELDLSIGSDEIAVDNASQQEDLTEAQLDATELGEVAAAEVETEPDPES